LKIEGKLKELVRNCEAEAVKKNLSLSQRFFPLGLTKSSKFLVAQIYKPGEKLDYVTKIPITVIDKIDTTEPYSFTQKEDEVMRSVGCFGMRSGPVFCRADIGRACFLPGESINFNAFVDNKSNKTMRAVRAKLDQIIDYFGDDPINHKIYKKTIAMVKGKTDKGIFDVSVSMKRLKDVLTTIYFNIRFFWGSKMLEVP